MFATQNRAKLVADGGSRPAAAAATVQTRLPARPSWRRRGTLVSTTRCSFESTNMFTMDTVTHIRICIRLLIPSPQSVCTAHQAELRRLRLPNRIANDSDSKASEFECRFRSDSKSDNEIISNRINLFSIKNNLFLIKFDQILIKDQKCQL